MRYFNVATALVFLSFAPVSAWAQGPTNSVAGFGGLSFNGSTDVGPDFGVNVGKELTPHLHVVGEFGRLDNMLPSFASDLLSFTPFDARVSAFYGEGGVRLLASPHSAMTPYAEATAGIARLDVGISGLGSRTDDIVEAGLNFLQRNKPIVGVGGGVLLRGRSLLVDIGYRYKQIVDNDGITSALSIGESLNAHQVRFGVGVRF